MTCETGNIYKLTCIKADGMWSEYLNKCKYVLCLGEYKEINNSCGCNRRPLHIHTSNTYKMMLLADDIDTQHIGDTWDADVEWMHASFSVEEVA